MTKPELLSPVGDKECLIAAIEGGCDAVYLGGYTFGARNFAANFSNEELIEAIEYSHMYGVKVYVTVNTIIYENEVERFLEYIDFLHRNNVDAIILQDLGMMDLIRKTYPNLEIHASTQMHVHNLNGVKLLESLGIKRAVLARETSIDVIKNIKENTNVDLEIFVHGALCVSYSGQCLMSSLIGGRSGNRGTCAQCCRMKYDLISDGKKVNNDQYLISTKDLNTILELGKLIDIGVCSLKIEGRMKRPEYVYLVTSLYRRAIDNYLKYGDVKIGGEDILELMKIFNRKFTKGFLFNEKNENFVNQKRPNHLGVEIGKVTSYKDGLVTVSLNDYVNQGDGIRILSETDTGCILNKIYKDTKLVNKALKNETISFNINGEVSIGDMVVKTSDVEQLNIINKKIEEKNRKVLIDSKIECLIGKPIKLVITDSVNTISLESEYLCENASKYPTTKERIEEQISKLGGTIYKINKTQSVIDNDLFVRIDELNSLRRRAIELLNEKRKYVIPYLKEEYQISLEEYNEKPGFNYLISSILEYQSIKNKDIKEIYTDNIYDINDNRLVLKLPRIMNEYIEYDKQLLVGELGSIYKYKNIYTDFSLNVTNSYTVAFLHSLGVKRVTLSVELSDNQIEDIITNYKERYNKKPNLELIVSSYVEAMVSKFNLLDYYKLNSGYLKDEKNRNFKVISKDNIMYIYDYKKTKKNDYEYYFNIGINTLRIETLD